MIIDNTYFSTGKVAIPQSAVNTSVTGNVPNTSTLIDSYIAQYEYELLVNAIGYTNYNTLKGIITADTLTDPGNEIWAELVNGKVYTYEDESVEWKGLRVTQGTIKKSLIANYVFYMYLQDDSQVYSGTGMQKASSENSFEQSPNAKLTDVWVEFIRQYQYGHDTCPVRITNSLGLQGIDWYSSQKNYDRSLYQFLRDNDNYGDYNFQVFQNRNVLGI